MFRPADGPDRSGAEGSRTPDLLNAIQALSQLSYGPDAADVTRRIRASGAGRPSNGDVFREPPGDSSTTPIFKQPPAGLTGLEPAASGVTDRHSNQTELQPLFFARRGTGPRPIPSRGIEPRSPP